jgi:hypothetical protein
MSYDRNQANSFQVVESRLASAVAPAGTFTIGYPTGFDAGSFQLAMAHKMSIAGNMLYFPVDFDLSFGATSITVTNKTSAYTWAADSQVRLQLQELGMRSQMDYPLQAPNSATETVSGASQSINVRPKIFKKTHDGFLQIIALGAPVALDADGICASQSMAAAGTLTINGSLSSGGSVTLDVPRALQVDASGAATAVLTITGTDVYGRPMSEAITLNGTTQVNGKKAFKTVTSVVSSAAIDNPCTVGTTDILGLPVFVPADGFVLSELQNGHKVGNAGPTQIQYKINQVDLLAGTAQSFISPVNGYITRAWAIVSKNTVVTGGNIAIKVGTTDVTGLTLVIPDGSLPGAVVSDTPTTAFSSTTVVTKGQRVQVAPDASFATSGDLNGIIEVLGTDGLLVPGIRLAGGSTTTSGDVRGTYVPSVACDGATYFHLVLSSPQRYPGVAQNVTGA